MKIAQQIVGVNQRLGNTAVPNMQGTTRAIYDSQLLTVSQNQTLTFFQGVSGRLYPFANVNNNRFEVGESLAITSIAFCAAEPDATFTDLADELYENFATGTTVSNTILLNLYIGNQRVIKDFDLNYSRFGIGEAYNTARQKNVIHLETPIVIPPQIEFYATVTVTSSANVLARRFFLILSGQGTLLNTKSTF
ncbi:MAG: hypothetical protein EBS18_02410 [Actinobacteria bacterium]|nr:hypothetical protein [Actinomycetota bacterium]